MDYLSAGLFILAALALLGSPGPAIAALIAVGKGQGFRQGLRFYGGLQVGLMLAAGASAAGLFSLLLTVPGATEVMKIVASIYLIYLAYKIAFAPVGQSPDAGPTSFEPKAGGGFLLGMTNPKSYISFISLMASHTIIASNSTADASIKWLFIVLVMLSVDLIWLWLGVVIGRANLKPRAERILNLVMGATILITAVAVHF